MKATKLFLSAIAFVGVFVACNPVDKPEGGEETPEVEKSTECRLTDFTAKAGDFEIKGFVDQTDKTIELSYMPNQFAALTAATAEVKISEKATISPDPAVARDYKASSLCFNPSPSEFHLIRSLVGMDIPTLAEPLPLLTPPASGLT